MKLKSVTVALLMPFVASGCLCLTGNCPGGATAGATAALAEDDLMRIEQAVNRAEDAAARAEAAAIKAATAAEKAEATFHRGLQK